MEEDHVGCRVRLLCVQTSNKQVSFPRLWVRQRGRQWVMVAWRGLQRISTGAWNYLHLVEEPCLITQATPLDLSLLLQTSELQKRIHFDWYLSPKSSRDCEKHTKARISAGPFYSMEGTSRILWARALVLKFKSLVNPWSDIQTSKQLFLGKLWLNVTQIFLKSRWNPHSCCWSVFHTANRCYITLQWFQPKNSSILSHCPIFLNIP